MAFWKNRLEAIDGFDVRYRSAGDDVDLCWRLQQKGWTLGFNAAAMVWHRRRNSVRGYWKQQKGYGRAEALLEEKWPQKYNRQGHLTWAGRIYTTGLQYAHPRRRIFHGVWGSALFQSVYEPAAGLIESLPLMPEWYLIIACLVALSALGVLWSPLWTAAILAVFAIAASVRCAWKIAGKVRISDRYPTRADRFRFRCLTAVLCTIQPLARLVGRLRSGLTPWRRHAIAPFRLPLRSRAWIWSQRWRSITEWLKSLESSLQSSGAIVLRGSEFDHWDLEVRGGTFGAVRVRTTIEEHGAGRQMVRFQLFPRGSTFALSFSLIFWALAFATAIDGIIIDSVILSIPALWLLFRTIFDCGVATSLVHDRIFAAKAAEREQRTSYVGAATGPEYQQSSVAAGSRRSHQQGY
jgi:hypothetical protein